MPAAAIPRSSPGRESSLDTRRESVWNLVSKFPTPFTTDLVTRKARHRRRKPKLEPLKIQTSPMFSFLDMSSPLETGTMKSASPYQHRFKSPTTDISTGSLYSVSLGPPADLSAGSSGRFIRRLSSEIHLSQLRSHWSDDSSNEEEEDDEADDDDNERSSSTLSPTFLNSWRNRFSKQSTISHRHSQSLPSELAPLSPLSKPKPSAGSHVRPLNGREEISIREALEDGPAVATTTPKRWSHKETVEDVALQFDRWRGFASK